MSASQRIKKFVVLIQVDVVDVVVGGAHMGYGCKKFGALAKNEIVRLIDRLAYAACKNCGWNMRLCLHTTGAYNVSKKSGYSVSFTLQTKLNNWLAKGWETIPLRPGRRVTTPTCSRQ